jgi:hypothetical protein
LMVPGVLLGVVSRSILFDFCCCWLLVVAVTCSLALVCYIASTVSDVTAKSEVDHNSQPSHQQLPV